MKDGLLLCKRLHISPVIIESDSMLVVWSIWSAKNNSWQLTYVFRECLELYTADFEIIHGVRPKNTVADRLVDIAHRHKTHIVVRRMQDLPRAARQVFVADQRELWNL